VPRVRHEDGFGLVELLIAMTVLAIGLLALVAAFSSGYVALNRANTVGSASVIADKQMETFRAMTFATVKTQPADSGWVSVVGPDGKTYDLRTTVAAQTVSNGRSVELVDVYVRQAGKDWVHQQSTFDQLTGS
jgi:prepilin-type N-terminal cleavage/methylation domain-containing protein